MLIADISHQNGNVYHGIGYLMGLNRGKGLKQDNFILIKKSDSEDKIGFNLTDIKQIRFRDNLELKNELIESLKIYYELQ